jgi:hypothetical protein
MLERIHSLAFDLARAAVVSAGGMGAGEDAVPRGLTDGRVDGICGGIWRGRLVAVCGSDARSSYGQAVRE